MVISAHQRSSAPSEVIRGHKRTSGKSSPSRSKLTPTSTLSSPFRRARSRRTRSSGFVPECMWAAASPCSRSVEASRSALSRVSTVASVRSPNLARREASAMSSSSCAARGRICGGEQRSSEVVSGHQRPSEVIRGHQRPSEVIRGHQRPSEVIRGHQRPSEVIRGHQRSSEAIRGHQRP